MSAWILCENERTSREREVGRWLEIPRHSQAYIARKIDWRFDHRRYLKFHIFYVVLFVYSMIFFLHRFAQKGAVCLNLCAVFFCAAQWRKLCERKTLKFRVSSLAWARKAFECSVQCTFFMLKFMNSHLFLVLGRRVYAFVQRVFFFCFFTEWAPLVPFHWKNRSSWWNVAVVQRRRRAN